MARIDWVRLRLENWARWCTSQDRGSLGYPSQSAFARLGGRGRRAEAVIPVLAIDAEETNRAVQSLRSSTPHLFLVLQLLYAQGLPRHLVARRMARTEDTVKRNLEEADQALARWFAEQAQARDRQRALQLERLAGARLEPQSVDGEF